MNTVNKILRVNASARTEGSVSRAMGDALVDQLSANGPLMVKTRDVSEGLPFVDADWVGAAFTPVEHRLAAQNTKLDTSDTLIAEIKHADTLVITTPIYNFGVPATLKAWIDQIARVGVTFKYTEQGPVGLLEGKRAYVLVASGGTKVDSEIDFASPYLRHVLGFIGIDDVTVIAADQLMANADNQSAAIKTIEKIAA